ncbi:uncharacterized protein LOC111303443 [Durio zibethinus]|uniref:Uncharacterized protein LOC111303443 n=1 Tax=Durio zibethinus TaxID=66656 RepID=A0A6P5ZRV7_DURZI|nr:uncharacterized protein LOC111303443 [Durio zibethinus]
MSVGSLSQRGFLTNAIKFTHKPKSKPLNSPAFISCRFQSDDHKDSAWRNEKQIAKLAIVTLAAGVLTLGSVADASAAKTGGRVGGQAFRSSAPRSAPRANSNSRTNIYINPPVTPPLVGGYGYGFGVSPFSFFAPGPSVVIGVGVGFETVVFFLFLGAVAAVVRRFLGSRDEDDY